MMVRVRFGGRGSRLVPGANVLTAEQVVLRGVTH
jgi:hypothetical protein